MPVRALTQRDSPSSLVLIWGEDEYAVKRRARELFNDWSAAASVDSEIVDATAANSGDALRAIGKLREALQTLPFFGSTKAVWFQNCNFLGDERAASTAAVAEALAELAVDLPRLIQGELRLLISAGKIDRRKTFYRALEKTGQVEGFGALSVEDRNWEEEAARRLRQELRDLGMEIASDALEEMVSAVGPNTRQLVNEAQKVALYAGDRTRIGLEDVRAVVTRNKQARAFALAEAFGDRDLPRLLRRLDEELWSVRLDPQKSEIGLLYGLIHKTRVLLLMQELVRRGWLRPEADFSRFKAQLTRLPPEAFPEDKRFNPLAYNAYVLFKALPQAGRYEPAELVRAMDLFLQCNRRLVSSGLDAALVLQQALVQIVSQKETKGAKKPNPSKGRFSVTPDG